MVGYLCLWEVADEVHITNVAVASREPPPGARPHAPRGHPRAMRGSGGSGWSSSRCGRATSRRERLYESFGFRVVGRRRGYYYDTGEDALVMEADLQAAQPGTRA